MARRDARPAGHDGELPARIPETTTETGMVAMDRVAAAMQIQAEVLKRLEERQRTLEDVALDQRRAETMIQSTRALNDSFSGMRKVQEKLLDRLNSSERSGRSVWLLAIFGIILVGGAIFAGIWLVDRLLDESQKDPGKHPVVARQREDLEDLKRTSDAALATISARLEALDERDRRDIDSQLDKLRDTITALTDERNRLSSDRDSLREELGGVKVSLAASAAEVKTLTERAMYAEARAGELGEQQLASKRMIDQLNSLLASKSAAPNAPANPATPDGPQTSAASSDAASGDRMRPEEVAATPGQSGDAERSTEGGSEGTVEETLTPVDAAGLARINALLERHRGAKRYVMTSAVGTRGTRLEEVVLEVRGVDGALDKTVNAKTMWVSLAATGDLLELKFEGGTVTFHSRLRNVTSRFFNDRYEIVILGASRDAWLNARYPFVVVR